MVTIWLRALVVSANVELVAVLAEVDIEQLRDGFTYVPLLDHSWNSRLRLGSGWERVLTRTAAVAIVGFGVKSIGVGLTRHFMAII